MEPLVDGQPGLHECWRELAEHSLTHDDLTARLQAPLADAVTDGRVHPAPLAPQRSRMANVGCQYPDH